MPATYQRPVEWSTVLHLSEYVAECREAGSAQGVLGKPGSEHTKYNDPQGGLRPAGRPECVSGLVRFCWGE